MFYNCTSLTSIPTDFFSNFNGKISQNVDISFMFKNCTSLTTKIDGKFLWNNKMIAFQTNETFRNATKINNYNEIPPQWK